MSYLRFNLAGQTNALFDITHAGGTTTVIRNQQTQGGQWVSLGTYEFSAGTSGNGLIRTSGTDGYVIADAVRWAPATTNGRCRAALAGASDVNG